MAAVNQIVIGMQNSDIRAVSLAGIIQFSLGNIPRCIGQEIFLTINISIGLETITEAIGAFNAVFTSASLADRLLPLSEACSQSETLSLLTEIGLGIIIFGCAQHLREIGITAVAVNSGSNITGGIFGAEFRILIQFE